MNPVAHYCVNCGRALVLKDIEGRVHEACEACDFVLWRDPKVVTIVVVEDGDGRLVLGRRGIEPGYGGWCLPGGFVNDDEHPAASAVRECQEEIQAAVEITGLLGVYHIQKREAPSMVGIAYAARLNQGQVPSAGSEMLEVAAVPRGSIPVLTFPSHRQAMSDWLARVEQSRPVEKAPPVEER
jgi:ADP-ribose pyrophosphatase YjhB (NUDIX family)